MSGKRKLANAHILLQCADDNHDNMCNELRDALLDKFGDVNKATTVKQLSGEGNFCVVANASIDPDKQDSFTKALNELYANRDKNSKVQDVRVYLEVE